MASPLEQRWYVVANDLIGGYSIANVDKPSSQLDHHRGEHELATFFYSGGGKQLADHIVELHNDSLGDGR